MMPAQQPIGSSQTEAWSVSGDPDETKTVADGSKPTGPIFGPPDAAGDVGRLGPYRIVKELGRGGMGAVYAALDTRLDRRLALKVMLPQFAADTAARERFLREARAAARVKHDNVVTVYEADERDGVPYIAMEFLEGYPLDQYLNTKGCPAIPQTLRIAAEAAAGLAAAHKHGLVHRDIKPANLWLEAPNGRVKVLDFGLARPVDTEVEVTRNGAVVGTPAYMSPEQARGERVDHRTDLFSLGAVMYRLCAGKLPFSGPTTMAVLMALGTKEPPPVRELNPDVPESLALLIHQLLSKRADDRPQSALDVVKQLRAIAREISGQRAQSTEVSPPLAQTVQPTVEPLPVSVATDASPFAGIDADATETTSAIPKPARAKSGKKPWLLVGLGALMAVVAAGIVIVIKNRDGTETKIEVPDGATVTVKDKAGKTLAKIDPEKAKPAAGAPDPLTLKQRKAVEWVLTNGGQVTVHTGASENLIARVEQLPEKPFKLRTVSFDGVKLPDNFVERFRDLPPIDFCVNCNNTSIGDTEVAALVALPNVALCPFWSMAATQITDASAAKFGALRNFCGGEFRGTKLTDIGAKSLAQSPLLMHMTLSETALTDEGLGHLSQATKWWHTLDVSKTKVTEAGVKRFAAAWPGCRIKSDFGIIEPSDPDRKAAEYVLSVGGVVQVNGQNRDLMAATDLPKERFTLTWVSLGNTVVTDAGLAYLKDCKGLTVLDLWATAVTDAGLANFKDHKELTLLNLGGTAVTDAGLALFKDCKGLTHLYLNKTAVTDAGLANFKDRKALAVLHLNDTAVTEAGLAHFTDCKGLTQLTLSNTAVTDAGLAPFRDCKKLTIVDVRRTKVTAKGLEAFHAAVPGCTIDHDGGKIEPKVAADPDRKAAEWVLSVGGVVRVNGAERDLNAVAELPKERFTLMVVNLVNRPVADAGLALLKNCRDLKHLNLAGTGVSDSGLAHFKECSGLISINLDGNEKITNAGLANFKDCKALTKLGVNATQVTDAGLSLFKDCKGLASLHLNSIPMTDEGLAPFKDCKGLKYLDLGHTKLTDAGLAQFKEYTELLYLILTETPITDAGLAHLKNCKALTQIDLRNTKVTVKGIADFHAAVPGCKIEHDGGVIEPKK